MELTYFRNKQKMKFALILLLSCGLFLLGIFVGVYEIPPYQLIKNVKNTIFSNNQLSNERLKKFDVCELTKINSFNIKSHVFIGHAYGSPIKTTQESFISQNVLSFIRKNSEKISTLIFTGDVFDVPSIDKWKRLRSEVGKNLDIFIAPGNHDVGRPDSNDVFKMSEFGLQNYPYLKYLDKTPLIMDDSTHSNWVVSNATINLINNVDSELVVIARHHSPINDLISFVNSKAYKSNDLQSVEELTQKFNKNTSYYWIIGDSGAFEHMPRLTCLAYKNHKFLLNGLGSVEGDSIILFNNQKFLEHVL
tara:strand:+ start:154 stop:1071 length:918 start_codon:yes stop_codon:yes gene_type:complete